MRDNEWTPEAARVRLRRTLSEESARSTTVIRVNGERLYSANEELEAALVWIDKQKIVINQYEAALTAIAHGTQWACDVSLDNGAVSPCPCTCKGYAVRCAEEALYRR